jgi:MFS family permease
MVEKIENALNESRILILGAQVLLGFEYQAVFQRGYDELPRSSQCAIFAALAMMLIAVLMLMSPAAYHRIVQNGGVSQPFHRYITAVTTPALFPFAAALGINFYVVAAKIAQVPVGIAAGCLAAALALLFWYGIEVYMKSTKATKQKEEQKKEPEETPLKDRIKFVMMEARVVLPGAQALVGFQFAAVLTDSFDKLPPMVKLVHIVGLSCIALTTVFLMAPAAFHRIVEEGEDSERLHRFASAMILAAMVFLPLGIAADVFVVADKIFRSTGTALLMSIVTLFIFLGWWFGYMFYKKASDPHGRTSMSLGNSARPPELSK